MKQGEHCMKRGEDYVDCDKIESDEEKKVSKKLGCEKVKRISKRNKRNAEILRNLNAENEKLQEMMLGKLAEPDADCDKIEIDEDKMVKKRTQYKKARITSFSRMMARKAARRSAPKIATHRKIEKVSVNSNGNDQKIKYQRYDDGSFESEKKVFLDCEEESESEYSVDHKTTDIASSERKAARKREPTKTIENDKKRSLETYVQEQESESEKDEQMELEKVLFEDDPELKHLMKDTTTEYIGKIQIILKHDDYVDVD